MVRAIVAVVFERWLGKGGRRLIAGGVRKVGQGARGEESKPRIEKELAQGGDTAPSWVQWRNSQATRGKYKRVRILRPSLGRNWGSLTR